MHYNEESNVKKYETQTLRHYAQVYPKHHPALLSTVHQAFHFNVIGWFLRRAILQDESPKWLERKVENNCQAKQKINYLNRSSFGFVRNEQGV